MKLATFDCESIQSQNVAIRGIPPLWERRRYKIRTGHLLFNSHPKIKATRCRHWWLSCSYFFCLTSLAPCCQEKWFLHLARILLILYQAGNPFKVIGAPIQVSGILGLTVNFTFNDCSFQIFFLFLKCLLASRLTLFRLSTLLCFASCSHCIVACFLWLKKSLTFFTKPRFLLLQFTQTVFSGGFDIFFNVFPNPIYALAFS